MRSLVPRCFVVMAFALMLAASSVFMGASSSRAFAADDATDYSDWSAVATAMNTELGKGQREYASGNTAGSTSDFMSAFNSIYVGSNFTTVVHDTIGADRQASQQRQFSSIEQLSYMTGNEQSINSQVAALSADLTAAGQQLDANPQLAKPRAYAKNLTKQIQADRKKLDAAKKKNNGKGNRTWSEVAKEMNQILDKAYSTYEQGNGSEGANLVNKAYYQYYEKLGFEKNVMNAISGNRVSQVEYQFKETRQAMNGNEAKKQTKQYVDGLKAMLVEDAGKLDGGAVSKVNPFTRFVTSSFGQAFIILLREGLEAILVVAAIIAYLIKSGNKPMVRYIYWGIVAGLIGSGLLAVLFTALFNGSGPQQEITEGVVALVAMGMLLYTSNWMLSRSSVDAWNHYIEGRTVTAVSQGSLVSLALLSFLAVFREGAETVMFYQAIFAMTSGSSSGIWGGFISAAVVLVIIFLLIRFTSVKIPIRPFFVITSALMAILVVIFAGGGIHALIEGDLVQGTYLPAVPTNDWLGLYPYVETIVAQAIAAVVVVVLMAVSLMRQRTGSDGPRAMVTTAHVTADHSPAAAD